jgi:hypothetical protein
MSTYDPKCEDLAREFLPSNISARLVAELSVAIQQAVEDWLESKKAELEGELTAYTTSNHLKQ